jgi:hypothetical protein
MIPAGNSSRLSGSTSRTTYGPFKFRQAVRLTEGCSACALAAKRHRAHAQAESLSGTRRTRTHSTHGDSHRTDLLRPGSSLRVSPLQNSYQTGQHPETAYHFLQFQSSSLLRLSLDKASYYDVVMSHFPRERFTMTLIESPKQRWTIRMGTRARR